MDASLSSASSASSRSAASDLGSSRPNSSRTAVAENAGSAPTDSDPEYFSSMSSSSPPDVAAALAAAVHEYRQQGDVGTLLDRVKAMARDAEPAALASAARSYMDLPEVVIPVYERLVESNPREAQPMVVL